MRVVALASSLLLVLSCSGDDSPSSSTHEGICTVHCEKDEDCARRDKDMVCAQSCGSASVSARKTDG